MEYLQPRHDSDKVDLAFIVDCTGSMGSYIREVQKHVQYIAETISRTSFDVKLALIEYRDHPPQDQSFVTRVHDFTSSLANMKEWVNEMRATGGGDWAEAVADALNEATKLSYRPRATKMCVFISDAPPHGLNEPGDGFPNGCPKGFDPFKACCTMAEKGIVMYSIGCEPAVDVFRDLLMGLAFITGGQYVPLHRPKALTKMIIAAAGEEVALEKVMGHATDFLFLELRAAKAKRKDIKVDDLAKRLHEKLKLTNNQCRTLQVDDQPLNPISEDGKKYSQMKKMCEAKAFYGKQAEKRRHGRGIISKTNQENVIIAENVHISLDQSLRIVQKDLARRKVPVTHDEHENKIVKYDTIPDQLG